MKIIEPYYKLVTPINGELGEAMLKLIESAGRTCYKSEGRIAPDSATEFVRGLVQKKHHESVVEHGAISVRFIADRGFTHELVRHRLAAYSQESTRYCNYSKEQFGKEITVIRPVFWNEGDPGYFVWETACKAAEIAYFELIGIGAKPQEARSVLPNSLKTEIVMTTNPREWRHVFQLRTSPAAHPQMRQLMCPLLAEFKASPLAPIYEDIPVNQFS